MDKANQQLELIFNHNGKIVILNNLFGTLLTAHGNLIMAASEVSKNILQHEQITIGDNGAINIPEGAKLYSASISMKEQAKLKEITADSIKVPFISKSVTGLTVYDSRSSEKTHFSLKDIQNAKESIKDTLSRIPNDISRESLSYTADGKSDATSLHSEHSVKPQLEENDKEPQSPKNKGVLSRAASAATAVVKKATGFQSKTEKLESRTEKARQVSKQNADAERASLAPRLILKAQTELPRSIEHVYTPERTADLEEFLAKHAEKTIDTITAQKDIKQIILNCMNSNLFQLEKTNSPWQSFLVKGDRKEAGIVKNQSNGFDIEFILAIIDSEKSKSMETRSDVLNYIAGIKNNAMLPRVSALSSLPEIAIPCKVHLLNDMVVFINNQDSVKEVIDTFVRFLNTENPEQKKELHDKIYDDYGLILDLNTNFDELILRLKNSKRFCSYSINMNKLPAIQQSLLAKHTSAKDRATMQNILITALMDVQSWHENHQTDKGNGLSHFEKHDKYMAWVIDMANSLPKLSEQDESAKKTASRFPSLPRRNRSLQTSQSQRSVAFSSQEEENLQ
jgi:hypothetical protein